MATQESFMEESLIKQLTSGTSQWVYRKDIRTEDQLWDNFRNKLNLNNVNFPKSYTKVAFRS
jgi:type I restriction enzyme R subunit